MAARTLKESKKCFLETITTKYLIRKVIDIIITTTISRRNVRKHEETKRDRVPIIFSERITKKN